jgi:hypothetical protein
MTREEMDRTRAVRAWLGAGSDELSPRVLEGVLRDFPSLGQERPHWAQPLIGVSFIAGAVAGAVVAVTLLVAMVGAGMIDWSRPGGPAATPTATPPAPTPRAPTPTPVPIDHSYRDVGFIGLPPRGEPPSDPTHTDLVENFVRTGMPFSGQALLYADGRLIWNEYFDEGSTGWLEQVLTDEGIELVRALASDSGGLRQLDPEELPARLPDSAWADKTVRPYVPSGFAACLFVNNQVDPFVESSATLPEKLASLPAAAADLLRDQSRVVDISDSYGDPNDCLALDVADARRLDAVLRGAGFEQDEARNSYLLQYQVEVDRPEPGTWGLEVWFEPILPDGTITCSSCG